MKKARRVVTMLLVLIMLFGVVEPASIFSVTSYAESETIQPDILYEFQGPRDRVTLMSLLRKNNIWTLALRDVHVAAGDDGAIDIAYYLGSYRVMPNTHFDSVIVSATTIGGREVNIGFSYPDNPDEITLTKELNDGSEVALTGNLPDGADAVVTPVEIEIGGEAPVAAYDIDIFTADTEKWQPADGDHVTVTVSNDAFADTMYIYHMADADAEPECVNRVTDSDGNVVKNLSLGGITSNANGKITLTENVTLYAKWTALKTGSYRIIYWFEDSDESGYSYGSSTTVTNVVSTFVVPANGEIKIVLPNAEPDVDSITAAAVNDHKGYVLSVGGVFGTTDHYGTGTSGAKRGETATYTGTLRSDAKGVVVTYTEEFIPEYSFDVNGGTWQETSSYYSHVSDDVYRSALAENYKPADPSHANYVFVGWTEYEDLKGYHDFTSTNAITFGSTTITPNQGENILAKIKSEYLWNFGDTPPYGETLYAVWSDAVTVTFDLYCINSSRNFHTWTGDPTVYTGTERYRTRQVAKGDLVRYPSDPTPQFLHSVIE